MAWPRLCANLLMWLGFGWAGDYLSGLKVSSKKNISESSFTDDAHGYIHTKGDNND
jgi:hypothetical protein